MNYKIYDKNILNIRIFDNEGYFFIIFEDKKQLMNIPYKISKNSTLNEVSYTIDAPILGLQKSEIEDIKEPEKKKRIKKQIRFKKIKKKDKANIEEPKILDKFVLNIKQYLVDIEKKDDKVSSISSFDGIFYLWDYSLNWSRTR